MCYEITQKESVYLGGAKCPLNSFLMENQIDIESVNLVYENYIEEWMFSCLKFYTMIWLKTIGFLSMVELVCDCVEMKETKRWFD